MKFLKVLFLTEGGTDLGLGHLSRCIALSQALESDRPQNKITFIFHGDKNAEKFLKGAGRKALRLNWFKKIKALKNEMPKIPKQNP